MIPRHTFWMFFFAIGCPDSKPGSGMDGNVDPNEDLDTGAPTEILLSTSLPSGQVFDPKLTPEV